jgi:DNA replication protein DnaC
VGCAICDDTGWKTIEVDGVERVKRCDCWRQDIVSRALAESRVQRRYAHCELANFQQHYDSLRDAYRQATAFVERFPVVDRGLLLYGSIGVGKTHLAVAILKAVIRAKGARGYFYETGELLKLVRDTYNDGETSEMDVLRPVLEADLLVLDDLGKDKPSEWLHDTLGHVVNTRYSERRPTIFTTNLVDSTDPTDPNSFVHKLGPRTRSRLFEMCDWVQMDGIDAREVGGPDPTPDQIARWQQRSPMSPKNIERVKRGLQLPERMQLPEKSGGQLRVSPKGVARGRDGKGDLKWAGGKAGN